MRRYKIATIVGSNRRESINRRLAEAFIRLGESEKFEFELVRIDDLPMYNSDLETARPAAVVRFVNEVDAADAALFVTPEHNGSIPAVLKNALDWGSAPIERNVWKGKPVAITGTSPGAIGTAVGQQHLRQILGILGSLVMGGEAYISFRPDLIGSDSNISNEGTREFLRQYLAEFLSLVSTLLPAAE
jgi:chromate reductase, NAD(P)H dehydrogenase (quinone)